MKLWKMRRMYIEENRFQNLCGQKMPTRTTIKVYSDFSVNRFTNFLYRQKNIFFLNLTKKFVRNDIRLLYVQKKDRWPIKKGTHQVNPISQQQLHTKKIIYILNLFAFYFFWPSFQQKGHSNRALSLSLSKYFYQRRTIFINFIQVD